LSLLPLYLSLFFFNHTPPTAIYPLSLHDALPICCFTKSKNWFSVHSGSTNRRSRASGSTAGAVGWPIMRFSEVDQRSRYPVHSLDRKSTRLNSSHDQISYAVFCLKKKKIIKHDNT